MVVQKKGNEVDNSILTLAVVSFYLTAKWTKLLQDIWKQDKISNQT